MWTLQLRVENPHSLMFLPRSQGLFVIFQMAQTPLPRGESEQAKLTQRWNLLPQDLCQDGQSLIVCHLYGRQPYVFGGVHRFPVQPGRRVQKKPPVPPRTLPQFVTNSALPRTVGDLLGEAADVVDELSHKTRKAPPELLFVTPVGKWEGFVFAFFLSAIKLSLYCMGMCIISLTISKYPHISSALRSCSQHGEEEK